MTNEFDAKTVHKYEHETWSRCADDYLDGFAGLTRETIPLLIEAAGVKDGSRVLEIGSGPGHIAGALVTEAGAVVTGIDFAKAMVDVARKHYPDITFEEANAEQLPFEPDTFDAVVSNFVVHHLARPEVVFKEIFRVLKPGGRFAFTVFADPEAQSSIGAFFKAVEEFVPMDDLPHGPLFGVTDLDFYGTLLREGGGLNDLKFDFRSIRWRSKNCDPILKSFWGWGNMKALPQELQGKIEAATRINLSPYRNDEGGYSFPHQVLLGSAAKP